MRFVRLKPGLKHIVKEYVYRGGQEFHVDDAEFQAFGDKFIEIAEVEEGEEENSLSVERDVLVASIRQQYSLSKKYGEALVDAGYDSKSAIDNATDEDLLLVVTPSILEKLRS